MSEEIARDIRRQRRNNENRKERVPRYNAEEQELVYGVISHQRGHYDEFLARFLLEEYGEGIGARGMVLVDDYDVISVASDEEADAVWRAQMKQGRRYVQLGVGSVGYYSFNEHRPGTGKGRSSSCTSEIVARRAGLLRPDRDTREYVGRLVMFAKRADTQATQAPDQLGRMLKDVHRQGGMDNEEVYRWARVWFRARLKSGQTIFQKCRGEFEATEDNLLVINGITAAFIESRHIGEADKYAMSTGVRADIVVVRNAMTGNVAIKMRQIPDSYKWFEEIAVEVCREELRQQEGITAAEIEAHVEATRQKCRNRIDDEMPGVPLWYMHKRSLLNGSESHDKEPTGLDALDLHILLEKALARCPERSKNDGRRDEVYKLLSAAMRKMEDQGDGAAAAYEANWLSIANILFAVLNAHIKILMERPAQFAALNLSTITGLALSVLRKLAPERVVEKKDEAVDDIAKIEAVVAAEVRADELPEDDAELVLDAQPEEAPEEQAPPEDEETGNEEPEAEE